MRVLLSGLLMVLCYSSLSVSYAWLVKFQHVDIPYLLAISFTVCAVLSYLSARRRGVATLPRELRGTAVAIAFAGLVAAIGFIVIFVLGPAMSDWAEKALQPVLLVLVAYFWEKERHSFRVWAGVFLSFYGFVFFLVPSVSSGAIEHVLSFAVLIPVVSAVGGVVSAVLMSRLVRAGSDRFFVMSIRYGFPAVVMWIFALSKGNIDSLTTVGVFGTLAAGLVLIGILYFALRVLEFGGAMSLGVFLLLVPVGTTLFEQLLGLYTRPMSFYVGAALIFAGAMLMELRKA